MTTDDLLRHLPLLFQSKLCFHNENAVCFEDDDSKIQIHFRQDKAFSLGAIRLPRLHLQFDFSGLDQEQIACFMRRFDRIYHKGGG